MYLIFHNIFIRRHWFSRHLLPNPRRQQVVFWLYFIGNYPRIICYKKKWLTLVQTSEWICQVIARVLLISSIMWFRLWKWTLYLNWWEPARNRGTLAFLPLQKWGLDGGGDGVEKCWNFLVWMPTFVMFETRAGMWWAWACWCSLVVMLEKLLQVTVPG